TRIAIASSCSAGVRPSGERSVSAPPPAATWCFNAPTWTMKNWSRFVLTIARNLSLAASGVRSSSAGARTGAVNSGDDRKALENWSAAPGEEVLRGEPLEPRRAYRGKDATQAAHQPDLDHGAAAGRRNDAKESNLAFDVAQHAPHRPPAGLFTAALLERQPQCGPAPAQGQATMRHGEHGYMPRRRRRVSVDQARSAQRGGARHPIRRDA